MFEISLERRKIVADSDTLNLTCQSVSFTPPKAYPVDVAADGTKMHSEKAPPALSALGVNLKALEDIRWEPTHLSFRNSVTGEQKAFAIHGYTIEEPDGATFLIDHELA